ncbi:hypothetical protein [Nocardia goodfellowii]|uniref:Uncharacterized protein n=1 Tax=Nocardia goodfellowii TaxID=882446 RepID=A0ABS4QSN2_9NOCA|nr:hypothetical protein [Nocardia goodfellowii]MBP2194165.1 hypothetical protein [Nocardia goodfellowii]
MRSDEGRGLLDAAASGGFRMPADAARRLGAACDALVAELRQARAECAEIIEVQGFPELPSGHALARGFGGKGNEYRATLAGLEAAALRLRAGYSTAGQLLEQADVASRAALRAVDEQLEGTR